MHYQLAVVGAGVSGMVAALLACKCGVKVVLVERLARGQQHSNAHYLDAYTLDILAAVGVDVGALAAKAVTEPQATSMAYGYDFKHLYYTVNLQNNAEYKEKSKYVGQYGPCINIRYDHLIQQLLLLLEQNNITVLWEHSFISVDSTAKCISLKHNDKFISMTLDYLLACDGSHSMVRQSLGVNINTEPLQTFVSFTVHSDLRAYVSEQALLYWLYHRDVRCCVVAHDLSCYQVVQIPIFPPYESLDDYPKERLLALLRALTADSDFKAEITEVSQWAMSSFVVDSMEYDWVYLAGDAAHTMTPAGGLGLNTALADIYNIVWKIAHCLQHPLSRHLSTYQLERHPVALTNVKYAYDNYIDFLRPAAAIGLDVRLAPVLSSYQQSCRKYLPQEYAGYLADTVTWPMKSMYDFVQMNNPLSFAVKQNMIGKIKNNAEHFAGLDQHLGFCYQDSYLVAKNQQSIDCYFKHGCRLPLVYIQSKDAKWQPLSTFLSYNKWLLVFANPPITADVLDAIDVDRCVVLGSESTISLSLNAKHSHDLLDNAILLVRPDAIVACCSRDMQEVLSCINECFF